MITLKEKFISIATFNYGKVSSEVYWFPDHKSSVEYLKLKEDIFFLRGSKEYYIADIYGAKEFKERYGWQGEDYHSRIASIGTFSDYLKKEVPSFELSLFYINSLSSGIVPFDASLVKEQIHEMEQRLDFKRRKLDRLKFDQEAGVPLGKDAISLEAEIRELKESLRGLEGRRRVTERLEAEYKSKGVGGAFVIRTHSPYHVCTEDQLQVTTSGILGNLESMDNVVKNQAWQGFRIIVKDLEVPTLAFSTESLGLFDPRTLEELAKEYGIEELEELKGEVEKMFVHRWAAPARVGETTYEKSAAIAQGIAYLMQRVAPAKVVSGIPEPDYEKLPTTKQKGKRLAYMGLTLARDFQFANFPYLYDLDRQGPMHTLIVGSTGTGKTICAGNLAEGVLMQNIPVLVLDTTNQWTGFLEPCRDRDLLALYGRFQMDVQPSGFRGRLYTPNSDVGINLVTNLLARPDVDRKDELLEYASETSSVIKALCNLSDREATYLRSVISEDWAAGRSLDHVNIPQRMEQWGAEQGISVTSTRLKLEGLVGYSFLFKGEGLTDVSSLWSPGEITVVALLHLKETQKLFCAYYLIRELLSYFYGQPDTNELKLLLIVEEVHRFIPKYTPDMPGEIYLFLERAVRELRKKGVGLVFISQVMSDFRPAMRANTATKIWLRNGYDVDVERASQELGSACSKYIPNLKVGQGVVSFAEFERPFFVQFRPPLHHPKMLPDEEVSERMAALKASDVSELLAVPKPKVEPVVEKEASKEEPPPIAESEIELSDPEMFLQKIREFTKKEGIAPRIIDIKGQLGWGDKKAFDVVEKLVRQGRVRKEEDLKDRRAKRLTLVNSR